MDSKKDCNISIELLEYFNPEIIPLELFDHPKALSLIKKVKRNPVRSCVILITHYLDFLSLEVLDYYKPNLLDSHLLKMSPQEVLVF
ncbi:MAG: hypothetical protein Ct9H90mP2_00640 [Dehalococcoidia bacterium]|nr:MAG: hypothetical protein Ct9H90mP2_00640 [Dehalococcoidia bacterium]